MFLFLWQMHTWEPCATSVPLRPIALALAPYPHSVQIHPINCEKKAGWRLKRYLFNYNFKWEKNIISPQNKFFNLCNFNPCNISAFGTSLTKYFFLKEKSYHKVYSTHPKKCLVLTLFESLSFSKEEAK